MQRAQRPWLRDRFCSIARQPPLPAPCWPSTAKTKRQGSLRCRRNRVHPSSSAPTICPDARCQSRIRELIAAGRISATSVMTVCRGGGGSSRALGGRRRRRYRTPPDTKTRSQIGAMPTLARAGRLPPVHRLLRASRLGRLPVAEIGAEIERQLVRSSKSGSARRRMSMGTTTSHQLPGVRGALRALERLKLARPPYLRSCHETPARIMARCRAVEGVDHLYAGSELRCSARRRGFALNEGSVGSTTSGRRAAGRRPVRAFIRHLGPRPLAMCYPGIRTPHLAGLDPMTEQANVERAFLAGDEWPRVLTPLASSWRHSPRSAPRSISSVRAGTCCA